MSVHLILQEDSVDDQISSHISKPEKVFTIKLESREWLTNISLNSRFLESFLAQQTWLSTMKTSWKCSTKIRLKNGTVARYIYASNTSRWAVWRTKNAKLIKRLDKLVSKYETQENLKKKKDKIWQMGISELFCLFP